MSRDNLQQSVQDWLSGEIDKPAPHWRLHRLAIVRYDGQGFSGFLERLGTSSAELVRALKKKENLNFVLSCYQEWLFFGLLHEFRVLCPDELRGEYFEVFNYDRFVEIQDEEEPKEVILFSELVRILRDFYGACIKRTTLPNTMDGTNYENEPVSRLRPVVKHRTATLRPSLTDNVKSKLNNCLVEASTAVREIDWRITRHWQTDPGAPWDFYPQLLLSLELLLESLEEVFELSFDEEAASASQQVRLHMNHYVVRDRLISNGWCPSRTEEIIATPRGSSVVKYLLCLQPAMDSRNHRKCSSYSCKFERGLPASHNSRRCNGGCALNVAAGDRISDILKGGSFPVLDFDIKQSWKPLARQVEPGKTFRVVPYQKSMEYIAISHVWSHGLGNSTCNGLPGCQIQRLRKYTTNMSCKKLWIDTICVPSTGPDKLLGISKLRSVYTHAWKVLVVDGRLTKIKISSFFDAKLQFLCCEWFSRLWTLQEGWLNSRLWVQFENVVLSIPQLLDSSLSLNTFPGITGLDEVLHQRLRPHFSRSTFEMNLSNLQNALWYRRVTEAKDEPICLATLLNLNLNMENNNNPTMKDIYTHTTPSESLLWSSGPRMTEPGFRWAPASLLNQMTNPNLFKYQERGDVLENCVRTEEGLRTRQFFIEVEGGLDLRDSGVVAGRVNNDGEGDGDVRSVQIEVYGMGTDSTVAGEEKLLATLRLYEQHVRDQSKMDVIRSPCVLIGSLETSTGEDIWLGEAVIVGDVEARGGLRYGRYVMNAWTLREELVGTFRNDTVVRVKGMWGRDGRARARGEWCID